jgi:hypothetical protein
VKGYDGGIFCVGWNVTLPLCQLGLSSSNGGTNVTPWLISTYDEEKCEFATLPVRHRASGMFLKNQKTDKVVAVNAPAKLICLRPQGFSPSCPAALFEAP